MKVCESCQLIFHDDAKKCPSCCQATVIPSKDDGYLKRFLGVDDKILSRFKEVREQAIQEAAAMSKRTGPIRAIGISGSARDQLDMAAEESSSEFLLKQALDELSKAGASTELLPLRKYSIQPCKACYSTANAHCHFYCSCYERGTERGDDMSNILYDKVLEADIIIFATPVNNFKISSFMSLFIDRCISLDGSLAPADPKGTKDKELNIKHAKFIELMVDQDIPGSGFLRRFSGKVAGIIATGHEEGAALAISSLYMTLNHFGMAFAPWSNMYAMSSITRGTYQDKSFVTSVAYCNEARQLAQNTLLLTNKIRENPLDWQYDYTSN